MASYCPAPSAAPCVSQSKKSSVSSELSVRRCWSRRPRGSRLRGRPLHPVDGGSEIDRVDGVIPFEHRQRLVAGNPLDREDVDAAAPQVRTRRVAQVVKMQVLEL